MTGFGNAAFDTLRRDPTIDLVGVFTPKRPTGPFPYYACEFLQDAVAREGVDVFEGHVLKDVRSQELIGSLDPDLIVVATYGQIIPSAVISIPVFGIINIHPSLLPKYRGSIPSVCALLNGERKTGVTAHFIEDERIDSGRIIAQASVDISRDDTDGSLRKKLSELARTVLGEAVSLVRTRERISFREQQESNASYCLKRSNISTEIDIEKPFVSIVNRIRALTPYPGASLRAANERYEVISARLLPSGAPSSDQCGNGRLTVTTSHGDKIEFHIKKVSSQ